MRTIGENSIPLDSKVSPSPTKVCWLNENTKYEDLFKKDELMTTYRQFAIPAFSVILLGACAATFAGRQDPAEKPDRRSLPDLVEGLKETHGCLGVETGSTDSGKRVIFAWFEDKKAAMAWYKSATHEVYLNMMGGPSGRPPMAQVPEGVPILCIASLTPSKESKIAGSPMPISQISIELYSVVPGGTSMGGTFAPKSLKIPNHERSEIDEKALDATPESRQK